ncbi:MAG: PilZ domain-containing protein [Thiomargarita sp.]|nr:PilZ domain-containing protein [Thiomargarita sp.]
MGIKRGKTAMLSLKIKNLQRLYATYLPFIKDGGLFIETEKPYKLGDDVFVTLSLLEDGATYPIAAKVVWINFEGAQGGRPQGIGVSLSGPKKEIVRSKIENALATKLQSTQRTFTM